MRHGSLLIALAALAAPVAPASAQERNITLIGVLVDSVTKRPIDNVDVYLPGEGEPGTDTDRDGRFRLRSVPAMEVILLFRKIGYSPRAIRLNLAGRESRTIDLGSIVMNGLVVKLDSITIETRLVNRNPRLADFYRRKAQGMGQYLTRQDIYHRNPMTATDLMRTIPGVTVECVALGPCVPASLRKIQAGQVTCPMRVMIDGFPSALELDMIPPAWIAGVEIYKSTAFLPLELGARGTVGMGNAGCGTIVIWTGADDY